MYKLYMHTQIETNVKFLMRNHFTSLNSNHYTNITIRYTYYTIMTVL